MTWGNLSAKSSSLVILLPVVLTTFSKEDIVVWYLYFTVVSLQLLLDFGFLPTFTRLFSYAYSGLTIKEIENIKDHKTAKGDVNWESLQYLFVATKKIYLKLAIFSFIVAITLGSYMAYDPVSRSSYPYESWVGWAIVVFIASFNLYTNSYVALLNGMDRVAIVQRWQMLSSLFAVFGSTIVIVLTKSLLFGIITYYLSYLINFIVNAQLVKKYYQYPSTPIKDNILIALIKYTIWPTAWKSGVGVAMSMGLIQFSGMLVAKLETSVLASSYMIALQIIRAISSFSQAPFYSRLPYFAQLYSKNRIKELIRLSKDRMQKSFLVFVSMYLVVGLFADYLLQLIGSHTTFVESKMWILLGFAFLLERYGAMYLQLYTLTNHIVWHIANGITGIIMVLFVILLYGYYGIYSFPLAMVIAYGVFYVPYITKKAYAEFNLNFKIQEKSIFILAIILFSISSILIQAVGVMK